MRLVRGIVFGVLLSVGHMSFAQIGVNAGLGVPFLSQFGLNYKLSPQFGLSAGYNSLDVTLGTSKASLKMPEILLHFHPLSGSWFVAGGLGQETLDVSATDAQTGNTASASVKAMTVIAKTGWMWGLANDGFWFGIDYSYISPSGANVTIVAPGVPTNDPAYTDTQDAAKKFGETAFTNLTFARIGWIF